MTEAGQNSAAPPPGLIKLVRVANSGGEAFGSREAGQEGLLFHSVF